uniref:Ubiquitin carboxyl-terminal hydrolase n=1 Tax=Plectus sambesii TaxID=2011161 RepID=A0A914VHP8_9BILA
MRIKRLPLSTKVEEAVLTFDWLIDFTKSETFSAPVLMGKKKRRNSSATSPPHEENGSSSSVDVDAKDHAMGAVDDNGNDVVSSCEHTNKKTMIQMTKIRKKMKEKDAKLGECEGCRRGGKKADPAETSEVWLCMLCGHQGCGRSTDEQHAFKHFQSADTSTPHHPLAFSLQSRYVWCYACDKRIDPVEPVSKGPLKEFLDSVSTLLKGLHRSSAEESVELAVSADESVSTAHNDDVGTEKKKKGDNAKAEKNGTVASKNVSINGVVPVKGLSNLGNTCFFNSVMQCLAQTHHLKVSVDEVAHDERHKMQLRPTAPIVASATDAEATVVPEPLEVVLEDDVGPLTLALADFLHKFTVERSVNPSNLFNHVVRKAPRFRGFAQQDSHELLRYLLDGLRCEEQARIQEAIKRSMGLSSDVKKNAVDARTASLAKAYFESAGRPRLDRVFGGSLLQSIECSECGHLSQKLEAFLDISVPIATASSATGKNKDDDLDSLLADNRGPSKHQKKKERQASRKGKRSKKNSTSDKAAVTNEDAAPVAQSEETTILENGDGAHDSDSDAASVSSNNDDDIDALANGVTGMGLHSETDQSAARQRTELLALVDCHKWQTERNLGACLKQFVAVENLTGKNRYECERCCLPANKKIREAKSASSKKSDAAMGLKNVDATKRYLVYSPPAVLTIHLKRFQQTPIGRLGRMSTRKLSGRVEFPFLLDLAPFCSKRAQRIDSAQQRVLYALYGVVSHSGDLGGGHYVAYVKARGREQSMVDHFLSVAAKPDALDAKTSTKTEDCSTTDTSSQRFTPSAGEWYYISDSSVSKATEAKVLAAEAYILFYERIQ